MGIWPKFLVQPAIYFVRPDPKLIYYKNFLQKFNVCIGFLLLNLHTQSRNETKNKNRYFCNIAF